jgi:tRNA threonylcarbamoyladenosine biosynthesis protein TsaB
MILALKTADEISELYLLEDVNTASPTAGLKPAVKSEKKWQAGRELGRSLLGEIEQFLQASSLQQEGLDSRDKPENDSTEPQGLVVFTGPGSFTGLRIGITTMNTIAYAKNISIVGASGEDWLSDGTKRLKNHQNDRIVTPNYGREPNITKPIAIVEG